MKSTESSALDACRKYAAAGADIKRLTREIGAALGACPGTGKTGETTHLSDWYKHGEWGFMGIHSPDYKALFEACPHCVLADGLIQQRKAARQTWGAAKRHVGKIGRAA